MLLSRPVPVLAEAVAIAAGATRMSFARYAAAAGVDVTVVEAASALAQGLLVITSSVPISYAAPELPLANMVFWVGVMANARVGNTLYPCSSRLPWR